MASCNPADLLAAGKCFDCLSPGLKETIKLQLLCQIANGSGDSGITQLTGDVTAGPGSGSQVATIAAGAVTLAKMANIATNTVIGRSTAGTGAPEALTSITPASAAFSGTAGAGFVSLLTQSSTPAAPVTGFALYADSSGRLSWRRATDGFTRTWDSTITANRVYSLPDATTTIAGLSVAQTWSATQAIVGGFLGIGTASPGDSIEVVDSRTTNGAAGIYVGKTGNTVGSMYAFQGSASGNGSNNYGGSFTASGSAAVNVGGYFSATGGTANYGLLVNQGNVGIGTLTPTVPLDVVGAVRAAAEGGGINSIGNGVSVKRSSDDSQIFIGYRTTPGAFVIGATYASTGAYKDILFATSDTERFRILLGGGVTIGTAAANAILTAKAAANLQLGAADAAAPVAQKLSTQSVVAGTSNTAGVSFTRVVSLGTGTGGSGDDILQQGITGASGTTQNTAGTRIYRRAKETTLTEATATTLFTVTVGTGKYLAAVVECTVFASDGTDFQILHSRVVINTANKAGTIGTTGLTQTDATGYNSAGTLTPVTYTLVDNGSGVAALKCAATSSLTQTTLSCKWAITMINSNDAATVTPN